MAKKYLIPANFIFDGPIHFLKDQSLIID